MTKTMEKYEDTYKTENHFSFGKNWKRFLESLDDEKINEAKKSLVDFLGGEDKIRGKTFVDIGCGSGLFSLAAFLLGASRVVSVDVDDFSLECAKFLNKKHGNPKNWEIKKGSALDKSFIKELGVFDIVYSWGVLHHTGDMWKAIENVSAVVSEGGIFFLAIYNKFTISFYGGTSDTWVKIKRFYNQSPSIVKSIFNVGYIAYILFLRLLLLKNPILYVRNYKTFRGMSFYTDIKDWLGGYPYEFAAPDEITNFLGERKLYCYKMIFRNGTGCNEYLFKK